MAAGPPFIKIPKVPPIEVPRVKLETGRTFDPLRPTLQTPRVNTVGLSLSDKGFRVYQVTEPGVFQGKSTGGFGRIYQNDFDLVRLGKETQGLTIAMQLASDAGFEWPSVTNRRGIGGLDRSEGYLVVRKPTRESAYADGLKEHVSFEYRGTEYNYKVGGANGYKIVDRIPLARKGTTLLPRAPGSFSKYAAAEKTILERVMPRSKIASTKVVDENGVPKRVYTGSQSAYDHADPSKYGEKTRYVTGMNFSESPAVASLYSTGRFSLRETPSDAAPNVRPSYLDIKNEFDMQRLYGRDEFLPEVLDKLRETKMPERYWSRKLTGDQMFMMFGSNEEFKASLIKSGYDGVTHVSDVPGMEVHRVWVPFTTDQIHPAILTESQRTELFKKLTGMGISAIIAAAMVAGRDAGDNEDPQIVKRRSSDPLLKMMGR